MAEQRTRNYRGRNKAHICLSRVLLSAVTWAAGSAFVESHIGPLRLSKRHAQITVRALHPHARHRSPLHQPPKTCPAPDAGVGFSGAPPIETGPIGLSGSRDVFLRDVLTNRARAFGCGMEDVVSGVTAFCRESTRAISEES